MSLGCDVDVGGVRYLPCAFYLSPDDYAWVAYADLSSAFVRACDELLSYDSLFL